MAEPRGSLCVRCGGTRWEQISATESRCAECGFGATRGVLMVATPSDAAPSAEDGRAAEEGLAARRGMSRHAFANASFAPYGLDDRWTGLRWFGGWGASNGHTNRLELAHGDDPYNQSAPQVRVGVSPADDARTAVRAWLVARTLVQEFWHETGVLKEDVRAAVFGGDPSDPFAPWGVTNLAVDGAPLEFRFLRHDDVWVAARFPASGGALAIQARGWPMENTGIVVIRDLGPYERGSEEIARRL